MRKAVEFNPSGSLLCVNTDRLGITTILQLNKKYVVLVFSCILFSSCAWNTSSVTNPQTEERVWMRSVKGNKEVLICSSKFQHDEDRVVVRLRCDDKDVLALQSYETPYTDLTSANESVRINWREDGNAVVVNLCVNGGTQETRPYYIIWDGCAARDVTYEPIWPANHMGEVNIYFAGWNETGKPMLKVE